MGTELIKELLQTKEEGEPILIGNQVKVGHRVINIYELDNEYKLRAVKQGLMDKREVETPEEIFKKLKRKKDDA